MTRTAAARLAWSLWALSAAVFAAGVVFEVLNRSTPAAEPFGPLEVLLLGALLTFPTIGAVVASRRPQNPIGWIFLGMGVPFGLSSAAYGYATYELFTAPGSLPGADVAAWMASWLFTPTLFITGPLLFLLFPDGRLLSPRWRVVLWAVVGSVVLFTASNALAPGPLSEPPFTSVANPVAIPGADQTLGVLANVGWLAAAGALAAAVSLVLRYRRAVGVERQQLKWLVAAAATFLFAIAFSAVIGYDEPVGQLAILSAFALMPVSVGIAILRHRLYDIDVVVNRALVYGALSATLAGAYLGSVLLLGLVVSGSSNLAIAGSTLAAAALFRPARRHIQAIVDRRFYRRRYDATRTLEAFGGRLRDEVDLDALGRDLRGVVRETLQPAHVSLWLRTPAGGR